jgi:uncharacterized membrane protein (DUF441 family)
MAKLISKAKAVVATAVAVILLCRERLLVSVKYFPNIQQHGISIENAKINLIWFQQVILFNSIHRSPPI